MKRQKVKRSISLILIACAVFLTLSGCMIEDKKHQLPVVTIGPAFTVLPTEEPAANATTEPAPTPVADVPVTFTDINFENAVREAIGRNIGYIYPADLSEITSFTARVSGIVNIKEIVYFTSLEELDLMGNRISDLTPLTSLKKLKKLNISKNFSVMTGDREKGLDISPVGTLPLLEELDASNNLITDISALASLKALRYLDLRTNRLNSLEGLEGCISLEYLDISGSFRIGADNKSAGISDLGALSGLTELKTLYASNGLINSLEPIAGLTKLEYLDATYNSLISFPDMKRMEKLTTLIVRNNNIFSLEGVVNAPVLATLDVRYNYIRQIFEVIRMRTLETIYLDGNPIIDYSPLDILEQIKNGTYVIPLPVIFPNASGNQTE